MTDQTTSTPLHAQFDPPHLGDHNGSPWNTREFTITDPVGNRFTFTGRGRRPIQTFDQAVERMSQA